MKAKQSHNTPVEHKGERIYSSYSLATSALDGVSKTNFKAPQNIYILTESKLAGY
jgi:hypothetical protein